MLFHTLPLILVEKVYFDKVAVLGVQWVEQPEKERRILEILSGAENHEYKVFLQRIIENTATRFLRVDVPGDFPRDAPDLEKVFEGMNFGVLRDLNHKLIFILPSSKIYDAIAYNRSEYNVVQDIIRKVQEFIIEYVMAEKNDNYLKRTLATLRNVT